MEDLKKKYRLENPKKAWSVYADARTSAAYNDYDYPREEESSDYSTQELCFDWLDVSAELVIINYDQERIAADQTELWERRPHENESIKKELQELNTFINKEIPYGTMLVPFTSDPQTVYFLVEDYNTGDTFGCTNHCHKVVGVFDSEEAALENSKGKETSRYFDSHNEWKVIQHIVSSGLAD
jgi:hypothetical protein